MTHEIEAVSISWRIARALREPGWAGEVLAAYPRSFYLADEDGSIYAVVQQSIGNGPFSLVIPAVPGQTFRELSAGTPAIGNGTLLAIGETLRIGLSAGTLWDPKAYPGLAVDELTLARCLVAAYQTVVSTSPDASLVRLLPHLQDEDLPATMQDITHFPRSHALIAGLVDALAQRNRRSLKVVTASLAGLGPGLTPSGDDFLAGMLVALALAHEQRPDPVLAEIAGLLLETAAPRTHGISAAYLRAAYTGEVSERWQPLIGALAAGDDDGVAAAALAVIKTGETSGADMLAGFLGGFSAIYRIPLLPQSETMLPGFGALPSEPSPPAGGARA
ncbi:MAG TPA: DUF2877 domain-containing protein [bacterium]|nr:DUF2877 domain-containing protein [bacterium]